MAEYSKQICAFMFCLFPCFFALAQDAKRLKCSKLFELDSSAIEMGDAKVNSLVFSVYDLESTAVIASPLASQPATMLLLSPSGQKLYCTKTRNSNQVNSSQDETFAPKDTLNSSYQNLRLARLGLIHRSEFDSYRPNGCEIVINQPEAGKYHLLIFRSTSFQSVPIKLSWYGFNNLSRVNSPDSVKHLLQLVLSNGLDSASGQTGQLAEASCKVALPKEEQSGQNDSLLYWPLPYTACWATLNFDNFYPINGTDTKFGEVEQRITKALHDCGYTECGYYEIPGGFAIVTRLERLQQDNISIDPDARWEIDRSPLLSFEVFAYFRALITANPGRFRLFVFTVTTKELRFQQSIPSMDNAMNWATTSNKRLPQDLAHQKAQEECKLTCLVYQFQKDEHKVQFIDHGKYTGYEHLQRSGLLLKLRGR